jgi:hypothetical protein
MLPIMLVYVDESGDAGMKLGAGSSEFFIVTAVLFEDHEEAKKCDEKIATIRAELRLSPYYEFHSNKCDKRIRARFLEMVAGCNFFYLAVVVDKTKLSRFGDFRVKENLIKYAAGLVFLDAKPYLKDATIYIDASGSKDFRNQLAVYLKTRIKDEKGGRLIVDVKTARSNAENLIQLADMVSGAVWRSFKRHDDTGRSLVAHRELKVQVFPAGK